MVPVFAPSLASLSLRCQPYGAYLGLALLTACASKPTAGHDAGPDAAGSQGDGSVTSKPHGDATIAAPDLRPDGKDAPTMSATGGLPFGWTSPIPIGKPGWQNTPTPLCDVHQGLGMGTTDGVWADSRGVFVLGTAECIYIDQILAGCPNDGQGQWTAILAFNDGSGWRQLWEGGYMPYVEFTGVPNGPLLLTGPGCGLSVLDPGAGTATCWLDLPGSSFDPHPTFVVNPAVAYQGDSNHNTVNGSFFDYRDGAWTLAIPNLPENINAIWGTEDVAYLAGDYQLYTWSSASPSALVSLSNAPSARYTAAWGLAGNDVWFGNSAGQVVHYDGTRFTVLQVSAPERRGIQGLWGQGDRLYFRTQTEFGRVVNGRAETLLTATIDDNGAVTGMWGTSPSDVFLSLQGVLDEAMTPCRHNSMFWFDGQTFHQF